MSKPLLAAFLIVMSISALVLINSVRLSAGQTGTSESGIMPQILFGLEQIVHTLSPEMYL